MANKEHVKILKQGFEAWSVWRKHNPEIRPNLIEADLSSANLNGAKLEGSNLAGANLNKARLRKADLLGANLIDSDLRNADLVGANLSGAFLCNANLCNADLREASLCAADCHKANLTGANLTGANLNAAILTCTNFTKANLTGCSIYGISAWDMKVDSETIQKDLRITPFTEAKIITTDNLEVAQFIYLLLTNKKIRDIIDTVAKKAVLVLGRFTEERKEILNAIANQLRQMDLCPIIFDFEKSEAQDIIETITTLASMSKFIIADLTDARVIPDELRSFVPDFAIPVVPIFQPSPKEPKPYASIHTLKKYPWVLDIVEYEGTEHLIEIMCGQIIRPAESKRFKH